MPSKRAWVTRFATFEYLQSIGNRERHNAPALGLVTIKRGYRERTSVVLTDKGRAVAAQVASKLRRSRRRTIRTPAS